MSLLKRLEKAEQEKQKEEHISDEKTTDAVFMPKKKRRPGKKIRTSN